MKAKMMSAAIHRGSTAVFLIIGFLVASSATVFGGIGISSHGTPGTGIMFGPYLDFTGVGSSTDTGASCVDLPCSGSDTCVCTTGSANPNPDLRPHVVSHSYGATEATYELSVDETAAQNDGTNTGECMPATGKGVITLADKSIINFVMSGLDCTVPGIAQGGPTNQESVPLQTGLFNGTLRLNGGTADHGALEGLGSIQIGDIGGGTTEVHITGFVLPPSQIIPPSGE